MAQWQMLTIQPLNFVGSNYVTNLKGKLLNYPKPLPTEFFSNIISCDAKDGNMGNSLN